MQDTPQIVYIAGWGRSGSTLLCKMLGEIEGWMAVGEVRLIWSHCLLNANPCACGRPFRSCAFWGAVFERAFGGMDRAHAERMVAMADRLHGWQLLARGRAALDRHVDTHMAEYVGSLRRLYEAMAAVSGARVLVDSSKMPAYGFVLDHAFPGQLGVVHLVRDPRACTYSWMRRRKEQSFGKMKSIGPVRNGVQWSLRNEAVRHLWRRPESYRLVRYEDLVAAPEPTLRDIASLTGDAAAEMRFLDGDVVTLGISHMAAGNPNRTDVGPTRLRPDIAWTSGLARRDSAIVGLLAAPWMHRYSYS